MRTYLTPLVAALLSALAVPVAGAAPDPRADLERSEEVTGPVAPFDDSAAASTKAPSVTTALSGSGLPSRLTSRSTSLMPGFTGTVLESGTADLVWSRQAKTALKPASAMKVLTATSALRTFGTRYRYVTPVLRAGSKGDYVYLKGVGDPTLSSTRLDRMAASAAYRLKKSGVRSVVLRIDDTLFPAPTDAPGWESGDSGRWVTPVRALAYDGRVVADSSMDTGARFRTELESRGITVRGMGRARTVHGATQIAAGSSPELRTIVGDMLRVSHNDYAEKLLWSAGMKAGAERTWAGVTAHTRRQVEGLHVSLGGATLSDGSGLSRTNRLTSLSLARLVAALRGHSGLSPVIFADSATPIAGRTGTLENRFRTAPTSCAAGRVRAKTGSLRDVSAMAGIAEGADGTERVVAVITNGQSNTADLRDRMDRLVATTTLCM